MKKTKLFNFFLSFIIIILAISLSLLTIGSGEQSPVGDILIVDLDGHGDFNSIQSAIDASSNGDLIIINNGIYKENNIVVDKKIIIQGEHQEKTIIDCEENPGFNIESGSVIIKNLKIINTVDYSIQILRDSNKCEIEDVKIIDSQGTGIGVQAPNAKITRCNIKGKNEGIGIHLRQQGTIIEQSIVHGFGVGVMILINSNNHFINDCVFYNNEKAVDIRINSNENIITNCDISYNNYGIYIWDGSNNNLIYSNNFWKNTVNAFSERNLKNIWNNETIGNYWDDYIYDKDTVDLTGETPYVINDNNIDNKPLLRPIYTDTIRRPLGVRVTSGLDNNKPSFFWLSSLTDKEIIGYRVIIDDNIESFVEGLNTWTSPESLEDGLHIFYVKAVASDNTTSDYATITFLIDTTIDDPDEGTIIDEDEQKPGIGPYFLLIIFIIMIMILLTIFTIYYIDKIRTNISLNREKKTVKKEAPSTIAAVDLKPKSGNIDITKNLLYDMQKTVSRYVDQLDEIEKQIKKSEQNIDQDKNIISVKQKDMELWKQKLETDSYENIETKVDSIIFEKMMDKKIDVSTMNVEDKIDIVLSKHFKSFKKSDIEYEEL